MAKKNAFDYFDAFEALTTYAVEEADILIETINTFDRSKGFDEILERAHTVENKGDEINHDIFKSAAVEFITPIEREDIIALSSNLDNVIDDIETVMMRFYMYDIHIMHENAAGFAIIIKNECIALKEAAAEFRNFKKAPHSLRDHIIKVNDCEEDGDRMYMKTMRSLYTAMQSDPVALAVWTDIFYHMEKCCDSAEHAADSMSTVLLKNA